MTDGTSTLTSGTLSNASIDSTSSDFLIVPFNTTSSGSVGMIRYNPTLYQFEGYSGSSPAWSPLGGGGSFSPVITSPQLYDMMYYNGADWVNGYPILPPTITTSVILKSISVTSTLSSSSPLVLAGTAKYHYQVSLSSDFSSIAFQTTTTSTTWTPGLSGGILYYVRIQQAMVYNSVTYSFSAYCETQSFTPVSDSIAAALSTSLSAYIAATPNSWVAITAAEWNNLASTSYITGATPFGAPSADWSDTGHYATTATVSAADLITSMSFEGSFSGYPYACSFLALQVSDGGVTSSDTFGWYYTDNIVSVSTSNVIGGSNVISASSWTSGQMQYYVLRSPTVNLSSQWPVLRTFNNAGTGHNISIQGSDGTSGTGFSIRTNDNIPHNTEGTLTLTGPYTVSEFLYTMLYTTTKQW